MKKIGFYIVVTLMWLVSLLPMRVLYIISDGLYYLLYYVINYRKKVVISNLKNSFPEKSSKEIEQITKRFYRHLCDIAVETIALMTISAKAFNKRVTYKNLDDIERFYQQGRPVIASMGHYGNWEWGTNFPMHTSYKALITYKSLDNKNFDNLFKQMRSRFGFVPITMKETTRKMVQHVRNGDKVLLVLIADQTPAFIEVQHYTTFLGQDTPVFMGPEKIAKAFNAPMVFINMLKVKRGHYEVTFTTLCENTQDTKPFELTDMQLRILEEKIREKPEYWLWSHRRWKYKREHVQPDSNTLAS